MTAGELIIKNLRKIIEAFTKEPVNLEILIPEKLGNGDYYTNSALKLASIVHKKPQEIADEIKREYEQLSDRNVVKIEIAGPGFINFFLSEQALKENLAGIIEKGEDFGKSDVNKGKKAVVEFSSPNIAKPFTVGHLRSTIIGAALANLMEATGWQVFRDNHIGDWGTQFGKQIYAIKTWGNEGEIEKSENPVKELVALYIRFHEEAEKDPKLEDAGRSWFKKLEEGDAEAKRLWQKCIDWSMREFDKLYKILGITFSENNGKGYPESYFEDKMGDVVDELRKKNLLTKHEGAELVYFPSDEYPPLMILKQDEASLYSTRDLATDKFRLSLHGSDTVIINEVGVEQSLYFEQLYKLEELLDWVSKRQRIHIKHGHFRFEQGKMSTRKGNVVWLEDVLEEAKKRAYKLSSDASINVNYEEASVVKQKSEINKRNRLEHLQGQFQAKSNSIAIAIGAIKWNDLKRNSIQDIVFDWDDILNMQGNSGPYMQYTYVRTQSVLAKASGGSIQTSTAAPIEFQKEESDLARRLVHFPEIVALSAGSFSPNLVANYLFELAQTFNLFYQKHRILNEKDPDARSLRLALTTGTGQVIKNGLSLLGIETVEKM